MNEDARREPVSAFRSMTTPEETSRHTLAEDAELFARTADAHGTPWHDGVAKVLRLCAAHLDTVLREKEEAERATEFERNNVSALQVALNRARADEAVVWLNTVSDLRQRLDTERRAREAAEQRAERLSESLDEAVGVISRNADARQVAESRLQALTEGIRTYGRHKPECCEYPCNCGFSALTEQP